MPWLLATLLVTLVALAVVTRADTAVPKTSAAMYDTRCANAYHGVRWYRARYDTLRRELGRTLAPPIEQAMNCRRLRERADHWRAAVRANQRVLAREWADPPEPYLSIAKCETGYLAGGRPNWRHHNSTYSGAYGFAHSTWAYYKYPGYPARAADASPRQQTRVAMRLVATFGGYSSWPACHRRLGLSG